MRPARWYEVVLVACGVFGIASGPLWPDFSGLSVTLFFATLISLGILFQCGVLSSYTRVTDAQFVEDCRTRIPTAPRDFLVHHRRQLAGELSVPRDALGPDTTVTQVMEAFRWFGLESSMLDGVRQYVEDELHGAEMDVHSPVWMLVATAWERSSRGN
jgi:hypothetical protein